MIKFEMNDVEEERYNEFIKTLSNKELTELDVIFSNGSGIGQTVELKVGKKITDITDYDSW